MEQFRQIGEVVGSLKALMLLKHDISINQRQCCLLFDMYVMAFETISEEIKQSLKLDERSTKWKALEYPMRELHKIIKEGELYIKYCLDVKDWFGKAMSLHLNRDCIEFHIHNLLCCFPVVIEAIETAAEISGHDEVVMLKRRVALMKKYDSEWSDPKLFYWSFGKQYLVPREIWIRLDSAWKEDRWLLLETIREKKNAASTSLAKHEQRLGELLLKKLNGPDPAALKLLPSSILLGASNFYVKRRLGSGGSHFKEIHWLGESFALRTFFGEIEPLLPEISLVLSLAHPNIVQYLCGFYDEERKEGFLVMDLMNKRLDIHVKENCGLRKRVPFSLPVAVDIMLQIARGMEYLHSKKTYHGDLNPSHVLLKQRSSSAEGYYLAKVTGFGLTSIKNFACRNSPIRGNGVDPVIWYAPEVLAEQEHPGSKSNAKYTEKADVYSFGMLCFELLTGKIPFEDGHLQGEKMVRNIRAGERPLFPYPSPKYLANLTRKCWQSNPNLRPSFSSICRILRYIKKILIINPDHGQPESPPPLVDYCDIEAGYSKKFLGEGSPDLPPVSQIPFQLFVYRLVEKEKISGSSKDKMWDLGNERPSAHRALSLCDDEHLAVMDDLLFVPSDRRSVCSEIIDRKNSVIAADQRSVISEIPHRRLFESDQRSVSSESPVRRFLSVATADQRSVGAITPERRFASTKAVAADQSPHFSGTSERVLISAITNLKKKSVETSEKETSLELASTSTKAEPNAVNSEVTEKKPLTTDQKPAAHEVTPRKSSSKTRSTQRLFDIPEKKIQSGPTTKQKSVSHENAEGTTMKEKSVSNDEPEGMTTKQKPEGTETKQKMGSQENPEKNTKSANKPSNKSGNGNPRSSEKNVMLKEKPRSIKTTTDAQEIAKDGPGGSPARITRTCSSPGASPARVQKEPSFPKHSSSSFTPKGYLSPRHSPLNPCARCARSNRETLLSSGAGTSPRRHKIGQSSEAEIS